MRINLLLNSYCGGGAERVNVDLAGAISSIDTRVSLWVLKGKSHPISCSSLMDVNCLHLDGLSARHVRSGKTASLGGIFESVDIKCADEYLIASLPLAESVAALYDPRRTIFWQHFPVSYSQLKGRNAFRRWYRKRRLKQFYVEKKLSFCSQAAHKDYLCLFGVDSSFTKTIYNPIDRNRVAKMASLTPEFPVLDRPYLIHLGRFVRQKRHDRLLDAFKIYLESYPTSLLLLCGSGVLESTARKYASELGISESVVFAGYVNNPYPFIKNANALVLSSDYECLPTVLLEALSLGVPCVSVNCPTGPEEILVGKLSNFLTEMNPESLADGMCRVWENPPDVSGYDFSRFDPKVVAQQYIDFLQE